jgi:hypothetical protein
MSDENLGLYDKYIVTRTDGKDMKDCIVMEFKDPIARIAIQAWACRMFDAGYKKLYYDVQEKLDKYNKIT